jgi:hypothetical protein
VAVESRWRDVGVPRACAFRGLVLRGARAGVLPGGVQLLGRRGWAFLIVLALVWAGCLSPRGGGSSKMERAAHADADIGGEGGPDGEATRAGQEGSAAQGDASSEPVGEPDELVPVRKCGSGGKGDVLWNHDLLT